MRSHVKSIGDYKITLEYEKLLILSDYFYILFFQRNLISVVKLVKDNYITLFNASEMFLIKENIPINTTIIDGLFKLNVSSTYESTISLVCSNKRNRISRNSSILWYRKLGHISQKRVNRLVIDGLLGSLDFTNFEACVDCIKSKTINTYNKNATKCQATLNLIHIDVCGSFSPCFAG